jgi:hypothetical protein
MRASLVPGGAGTISGIASTPTCGGDHVRVRRACLRCPHPLLPRAALLSKRIKGDRQSCRRGRKQFSPITPTLRATQDRPRQGSVRKRRPIRMALSANGSRCEQPPTLPVLLRDPISGSARPRLVRSVGPSSLDSPRHNAMTARSKAHTLRTGFVVRWGAK